MVVASDEMGARAGLFWCLDWLKWRVLALLSCISPFQIKFSSTKLHHSKDKEFGWEKSFSWMLKDWVYALEAGSSKYGGYNCQIWFTLLDWKSGETGRLVLTCTHLPELARTSVNGRHGKGGWHLELGAPSCSMKKGRNVAFSTTKQRKQSDSTW